MPTSIKTKREVILQFAIELHHAGAAAHRIEDATAAVARSLDTPATVFSSPTTLHVSFAPDDIRLIRVRPREVKLDRLAAIDVLVSKVVKAEVNEDSLLLDLQQVAASTSPWPAFLSYVALAQVAFCVAMAFGGSLNDGLAAATIGLGTGILGRLLDSSDHLKRSDILLSALLAGIFANWLGAWGLVSAPIVMLAGLIVLFPGFSLTTAITEIATGHLSAGSARLTAAAVVLIQLAVGAAVALVASTAWYGSLDDTAATMVPLYIELFWFLFASVGLAVILQVPPRWVLAVVTASALSFLGSHVGVAHLGPELGVCLGAFSATVFANAFAKLFDRPALMPLVPAIFLVVPGSVGYRGMLQLATGETLTGIESAVSMIFISGSIVAGMLLANSILSPRRAL